MPIRKKIQTIKFCLNFYNYLFIINLILDKIERLYKNRFYIYMTLLFHIELHRELSKLIGILQLDINPMIEN